MIRTTDLDTCYSVWVEAETRYAQALAAFTAKRDRPAEVVQKQDALELASARNGADMARDQFFRRALA